MTCTLLVAVAANPPPSVSGLAGHGYFTARPPLEAELRPADRLLLRQIRESVHRPRPDRGKIRPDESTASLDVRNRIVLRDGVEELGEVQAVLLFRPVGWVWPGMSCRLARCGKGVRK